MKKEISLKSSVLLMLSGIAGCILMGAGDWVMIYGDTAYNGNLAWLTEGAAAIPPWRNTLTMVLAFIAVIFYGAGLMGINRFITEDKHRKIYSFLTLTGMTPWLCLHLLYTVIIYLFYWMRGNYQGDEYFIYQCCENLFRHFTWIIFAGEALILLPFIYLFFLIILKKTVFSRWFSLSSPLLIYVVLKIITSFMPDVPARLAFTNGLMSESMLIWFISFIIAVFVIKKRK